MSGVADATVEIIRADVRAHTSIEWQRVESLLGHVDALAASVRELEAEEALLRRLLWLRHGCPVQTLYGDDGEMQCGTCGIDFVRATAETIQAIWRRAAIESINRPPP